MLCGLYNAVFMRQLPNIRGEWLPICKPELVSLIGESIDIKNRNFMLCVKRINQMSGMCGFKIRIKNKKKDLIRVAPNKILSV